MPTRSTSGVADMPMAEATVTISGATKAALAVLEQNSRQRRDEEADDEQDDDGALPHGERRYLIRQESRRPRLDENAAERDASPNRSRTPQSVFWRCRSS